MALDMTPEQKEIGKGNFQRAVGGLAADPPAPPAGQPRPTRRSFMKGLMAAGAVLPVSAAAYFGYQRLHGGNPVRAALIGTGDEGGILVGDHNPDFVQFVAACDIRPYNKARIFEGENPRPGATLWRKGFKRIYGNDAERRIRWYDRYQDVMNDPDVEMVVIALPLHLHAEVSIAALNARKHVLCEKLMAWNVAQCKQMIEAATRNDRLLSIGHQRHYSLLYAQAYELLEAGVLGDVKHIRALWHRNNTGGRDSWRPAIRDEDKRALEARVRELGYKSMEELVRWRLYYRTGGGLMAELGSHQLDACSIFLGKKHPLAVSASGGKYYYTDDRETEDHVFCTFEFPGKEYQPRLNPPGQRPIERESPDAIVNRLKQRDDLVVVTYSSVNTNAFEQYGECVMGSRATLIVEQETSAMLYPAAGSRSTQMAVTQTAAGQPSTDTSATWVGGADATAQQQAGARSLGAAVSRGYREEMEHMAWCIRMHNEGMDRDRENLRPRCHGQAAMADAIIALAANRAMRFQERVEFDERWFDTNPAHVPSWDPQPPPMG